MTKYRRANFESVFVDYSQKLEQYDKRLLNELSNVDANLGAILDAGFSFADNFDGRFIEVTSHATPGTEFSVTHSLGKVHQGYIVTGQSGAGSLYDGTTASTATTLYLRASAGDVVFRLLVF